MESADGTTINALGLSVTILMGIVTLGLPRKYAPIPMLAIGITVTLGQIWYVAGLHFTIMRIMLLFGWARIIIRSEIRGIKLNEIDKIFILWVTANFSLYCLRELTSEAVVNRLGFAYNALGLYFFFRCLIRDDKDILRMIKALAMLVIPLATVMLFEKVTGRNLYSYFGGVAEYTIVRDGRLRCQGPFMHPILAGSFGVIHIPLFAGLWYVGRAKLLASIAIISATTIAITSASGGPVLAYAAGLVALMAWNIRRYMRVVRWGILISVIVLHIVMKSPVWYLIGRFSEIVGGTGWHRSELINSAIIRFDEWWLWGTNYTAHWMPYVLTDNPNSADITNYYIRQGVDGGLLTMILLIVVISLCFRRVGMAVKSTDYVSSYLNDAYLPWALGAALFVHVITFFSVSYFDQLVIYLFILLAMIASLPRPQNSISP